MDWTGKSNENVQETMVAVTFGHQSSTHLLFARLKYFSQEGMCLETSSALTPGTRVKIRSYQPLFGSSQKHYDAVIKWCNGPIDGHDVVYNFLLDEAATRQKKN